MPKNEQDKKVRKIREANPNIIQQDNPPDQIQNYLHIFFYYPQIFADVWPAKRIGKIEKKEY